MLTSAVVLAPPTGCPGLTICAGSHGPESRKEALWLPKWTLRQDPDKPRYPAKDDAWSVSHEGEVVTQTLYSHGGSTLTSEGPSSA